MKDGFTHFFFRHRCKGVHLRRSDFCLLIRRSRPLVAANCVSNSVSLVTEKLSKLLCHVLAFSVWRWYDALAFEHKLVGHAVQSFLVILTLLDLLLIVAFLCSSAQIPVITIGLLVEVKVHCECTLPPFPLSLTIFVLHSLDVSRAPWEGSARSRVLVISWVCLSSNPLRTLLYWWTASSNVDAGLVIKSLSLMSQLNCSGLMALMFRCDCSLYGLRNLTWYWKRYCCRVWYHLSVVLHATDVQLFVITRSRMCPFRWFMHVTC